MPAKPKIASRINPTDLFTFFAITIFYFFESAQMSYFNVLAPGFLSHAIYQHDQIASLSAAYYYGDMAGLLPVGLALDRFPLRKILLWAIIGSVISAFLLLISQNFTLQWLARFLCGFFGGTFSFVGGIRVLAAIFPKRFTFFMGLFLSAGMFGGLICQYPLLIVVDYFGEKAAMAIVAVFGLLVIVINFLYLKPSSIEQQSDKKNLYAGSFIQMWLEILKNYRNWLDCLMVVLLDTPVSIIGTLWGVVVLMNYYHFSDATSAWIVMSLFAGLIIGLPIWGAIADRYKHPAWIIILGASVSCFMVLLMLALPQSSGLVVASLFFGLGFFSSCQTLGFTWLIKDMRPELIGTNSAFNSMIFMGTNGGFKQIAAYLLISTPLIKGFSSSSNIFILISIAMFVTVIYACIRNALFSCFITKLAEG
jgi:MFS family permease